VFWDLLKNEVQQNKTKKKSRSKPNNIFVALSTFVVIKQVQFIWSKVNTFLHI